MIKASNIIVLATVSLLGSTLLATAQTPAAGADAGVGADAVRAERIEDGRLNRGPGITTGESSVGRRELERATLIRQVQRARLFPMQ